MDYYSLFWGPGVISTINELWGAFTCWSSTLIVLANSGPFRGQLLTVLGPGMISRLTNPRVRLRVGYEHSQFWPILTRFVDF